MDNEFVRQNETFEVTITDTDLTADHVTMTIFSDSGIVHQETASYSTVDGKRIATVSFEADFSVGEYSYMYRIFYDGTRNLTLPDVDECDGDCDYPVFTVCEAGDESESS